MAEPQDDSICRLIRHLSVLNETLDSDIAINSDHSRAIKVLRHSLLNALDNVDESLKVLKEQLAGLDTNFSHVAAVVSDKGKIRSFDASLEDLLGNALTDSLLSNSSKKAKFCDEDGSPFSSASLPWKKSNQTESFNPQIFLRDLKSEESRAYSCLISQLQSTNKKAKKEKSSAVLFSDLTEFLQTANKFTEAAKKLDEGQAEIHDGTLEILELLKRIKEQNETAGFDEESEPELPRTSERPPDDGEDYVQSGRVLIVDDIAINLKLMARRLEKLKFTADFARNGKEGLELALANQYDLIFMDCDMPVMNGFEATRLIRQSELSTGRHVPIVAMTAYDRDDDREKCLSSGMDEYLSKGASANLLAEIVDWCLRRSMKHIQKHLSLSDYEEELDLKGLAEIYDKEELDEVLDLFLPSTNTLMRCLKMSMDERDIRSIGHFAYSLKGPFSSLGMVLTGQLTARLTDAAEEGQWDEANDYYDMLARNCEAMRRQLEDRHSKAGH